MLLKFILTITIFKLDSYFSNFIDKRNAAMDFEETQ